MAATDNIRVAIRVRPLIKRENDFNQQINWRVDGNTITQLANGKIVPNSSYFFDRIFDTSNSTQDVYDEFGKPTVLSAMDGFNGTLFAYGQTSSGKTHTMMGDQQHEGVIPKAVGEIYDYINKHPSREFLIRVSYMEIYNEDIKDLLNPSKTNLKIHENTQKQVYVGDLTEEVVSGGEDVFKHMTRGEKNRHFGETNMNERSSRSHTIFRVVIESREMMDESKDRDAIDGAVRVAHLNLVDLAGSERASQTGAFGQRLKEGGHINKSLLALGSVIAKLSEGESFIPFRDSKLTRILQSSLGGNAKTSMICTITPAAIEETISTLKFASRAKTIKNCPEVNEVLDDGTLLKRYRKEIRELKKQLVEMSGSSHVQELQLEKEKVYEMEEMLEQQRRQQSEQEEKIKKLCNMICSAGRETETKATKARMAKRRETWCPGALLSKAPLASAAALVSNSVQSRLQRISSSPSSEESEFDEMPRDAFLSTLEEEEERKSIEDGRKKVNFASPRAKRCLSPILDKEQEDKEMQTEPDEKTIHMELEVKKLRKDLQEAIQERDYYNELLEESNTLLEKLQTENGHAPAPSNLDTTLKYVAELRKEKTDLETQVSVLQTQCQELENLKARNKVLEDEVQSMENERTLSNEYLSELQAEFDSVQAEKQALAARVEGLENTGAFNTATKMEVDSLQMALEESAREKGRLEENLEMWKEKYACLESDVARLQNELSSAAEEKLQFEERLSLGKEEASVKVQELEIQVKEMEERFSNVGEQERMLTQVIEEKLQLEESKKVEVDSLKMALEEGELEKGRLQENLETWKEKFTGLESDVTRLQNELLSAAEEKLKFEERLSLAKEEASVKVRELEIQVKEMEERFSNVDEQERMLTQVIEEKLQLEECKKEEVGSLKMALQESVLEKGRLQENLETWKEKYARLESDVTRFQNELSSAAEEKHQIEERLALAKKEAVVKVQELEIQLKQMEDRLSSVDEQEGMLTQVIEEKLQLEESKKEVGSLQIALEEISHEKEKLEENLETWKEKYASLESDVTRLQNELSSAAEEKVRFEERLSLAKEEDSVKSKELEIQVKEMEERLSSVDEQEGMLTQVIEEKIQLEESKKVEVDSLKMALEESALEKGRLEENLETWKEKYARLESDVTRLQNELSSAAEEKVRFEERLSLAKEEGSVKVQELEIQVKEMEERLSSVNEQEGMLPQVIEEKLQLEETKNVEVDSLKMALEESALEKGRLEENLETWKGKYASLESDVTRLQNELSSAEEEKLQIEERLSVAKEEASVKTKELEIQLKQMEERLSNADEQERMLTQVIEQKLQLEENVERLKTELAQSKESFEGNCNNITQLTKKLEQLKEQRKAESCELDEKDMIEQRREVDAKVSDLEVQLERMANEKKECEQTLERVKKERDEIKNDLSESISDNAELQKDVLDMQQKVKRYKEHIRELESELEQSMVAVTSHEQKTEELQNELNEALERIKQSSQEINDETIREEQNGQDNLASLLSAEKERAEQITQECNSLKSSLETLENRNEVLENEAQKVHREVEQLQERIKSLESELIESKQDCDVSKKQLKEEKEKCEKLVKDLDEYKSKSSGSVSFEVELQKAKKQSEELVKELSEEKKLNETLRKEHSSLAEELQHFKDSLLRDTNRGMDQQRVIDKMKAERRETICVQAHQRQELEKDLFEAEKKVSELQSQCTLLKSEKDVLEHRLEVANKKVEETRQEMRDMENLYSSHNTRAVTQLDENKAMQKLKQMEFSVDLTKQKCDKAERRVKELENENRQLRGADIRNGALTEERDNFKQQLHKAKQVLDEKSKKLNEISIEVTQLRAHVDKLSEENKKHRCSIEKKDNKIDNLEQKLWEIEEELKLEKQRCQEQQAQGSVLEELNSTIQVKHEALEHMTFLVDEKDIEIAEVRSSLEENELKQLEMAEKSRRDEERLHDLESELSEVNKSLEEERNGRKEADDKILELKGIIQQQESELIAMNEKIESRNAENISQSHELDLKNEKLESDLQDMEHKLLEVETELEFTKNSLEKLSAEKEDLNNQAKKSLEEKELLEVKIRELQASFDEETDELRKAILNEKKLVSDLEEKVHSAETSKRATEAELRRVQESGVSEKEVEEAISLRQELDEQKEKNGLLDIEVGKLTEKKDQLESLVQSSAVALEEEKKRLEEEMARMTELCEELEKEKATNIQLVNEVGKLTEENCKLEGLTHSKTVIEEEKKRLEGEMARMADLCEELEKEKIANTLLVSEVGKLTEENCKLERLAQSKTVIEEEKRKLEEDMARFAGQFEEERTQLRQQLREISALKVKESEDCYSEKDEKIKDLEVKLAAATKNTEDYKQSVEHYQLKLAKAEYELDTTVARLANLEKQNSTITTDVSEVESLRKECEAAKKKTKDTLERYFSESDRLKAIIDEMHDEEEEYVRQIEELKQSTAKKDAELSELRTELAEAVKKTVSSVDHSEMESLRTECEAAKKKAKDTLEKYFKESDRLKAIIDEQQEIIDKAQNTKETEEEMEATRIELAEKNMQLQSLQYDLYKLQEKYDKEMKSLTKEVEWGRDKVGSLKLEIRRLKEQEPEDTISIIRGQPVASKQKEDSDVGVVSNVAIYSLKAKVGKLESETQKLSEKVHQLEREKSTLSLLNTEASNKVAQLTSENKALKTHKKKLMDEVHKLKGNEDSSKVKNDSGRRLPEVPTETLEKESRNASILSLSSTENISLPAAERKKVKPEPKENFRTWLSEDAANNMFQDEPNQCANQ